MRLDLVAHQSLEIPRLFHSRVGGEFPLPTMTIAPSLDTSSIVRNIVAGPGGYTRPFGGVTNDSVLPLFEMIASMNTRRAPTWNPCVENPRSINDTTTTHTNG